MSAVNEMERKVIKMGNSLGVNMTEALKRIGAKKGDALAIEIENGEIKIKKQQTKVDLPAGISEDFFDILESTIQDYDQTLKGLKDR